MRVDCNVTDPSYTTHWNTATFNVQLIGGNAYPSSIKDEPNLWVGGGNDYFDPADSILGFHTTVSGTYNCWCICAVGNSGGAQDASTGGTLISR